MTCKIIIRPLTKNRKQFLRASYLNCFLQKNLSSIIIYKG